MSSLTRPKETEHLKSYCHMQDQIVSWNLGRHCQPTGLAAGTLRGLCRRDAPGLCRRCAPAHPNSTVGGIDWFNDLNLSGLYPSHTA
jgi:hypothetical protein